MCGRVKGEEIRPGGESNLASRIETAHFDNQTIPIVLLNVRSIRGRSQNVKNKILELETYLEGFRTLPIVLLCETWLLTCDSNSFLPIANQYVIYRSDRTDGRRGGGVAILIPKSLPSTTVPGKQSCLEFESAWCRIISKKKSVNIGLIYRPPGHHDSMPDKLISHLGNQIDNSIPTILAGDFNYGHIDWYNSVATRQYGQDKFLDFTVALGMTQTISFPTRNAALLDLIFINEPNLIQCVDKGAKIFNCDHETVTALLTFQALKRKSVTIRNYRKADYSPLNSELVTKNWPSLFQNCASINEMWTVFLSVLTAVVNFHIPQRTTINTHKSKISFKVKRLCRKAWRLFRNYKKKLENGSADIDNSYDKYLSAARLAQSEKRKELYKFEENIILANNSGALWNHIKSNMSYKSGIPCILGSNGSIISDIPEKAERFNEYFSSVFTKDNGICPQWNIPFTDKRLSVIDFSPETVWSKLKNLSIKTSAGPDHLPTILMKKLSLVLAEPLSIIFTHSFINSELPNHWKLAHVLPFFKKGDNNLASNYRPISLTCVSCRVMESIIADAIMDHMSEFLFKGQHGFRGKRSTVSQLLETLNDWMSDLNAGNWVDVLYIDFTKAFDIVSHPKLLSKLECYGISGLLLQWIREFLSDRRQTVIVEDSQADFRDVPSGVPQGSVLGPILFLIYINDLPSVIRAAILKLFADDCKLYIAFRNNNHLEASRNMQSDVTNVQKWADDSQSIIASSKCGILHLGHKNPCHDYYFGDAKIPTVDSIKDLGITVSNDLSFRQHITDIVRSANVTANLILRNFTVRKPAFLMRLFNTYVRPKLEYGCQVWNPHKLEEIDLIEKVQRKFTKRLPGMKNLSYSNRLIRLDCDPLELRRLKADLTFTFKIFKGYIDVDRTQLFELKTTTTRGHHWTIKTKFVRKAYYKHFFTNRVVNIWNRLPNTVINSRSTTLFKTALKSQPVMNFLKRELKGRSL